MVKLFVSKMLEEICNTLSNDKLTDQVVFVLRIEDSYKLFALRVSLCFGLLIVPLIGARECNYFIFRFLGRQ